MVPFMKHLLFQKPFAPNVVILCVLMLPNAPIVIILLLLLLHLSTLLMRIPGAVEATSDALPEWLLHKKRNPY